VKPALDDAQNTPNARTVMLGAIAITLIPMVAAIRPRSTGASGPHRLSRACAPRSPARNPEKPMLDTKPTDEVDIENAVRNSGTNNPKPIRAGPKDIVVAAKPAADKGGARTIIFFQVFET